MAKRPAEGVLGTSNKKAKIDGYTSSLFFSQYREDALVEMLAVRLVRQTTTRPLRVLVIASGGETGLSLLSLRDVGAVHMVDGNPAQLHLVKLKCALVSAGTSLAFQKEFLGCTPSDERLEMYHAEVRAHLPSSTAEFWDAHLNEIAFGVNRAGRFEELFRELSDKLGREGLDPINHPLDALRAEDKWNAVFASVFARQKLIDIFGENAVNFSMSKEFYVHFRERYRYALARYDGCTNYFLHSIFKDSYPTASAARKARAHHLRLVFWSIVASKCASFASADLVTFLKSAGYALEDEDRDLIFSNLDRDGDGSVSSLDFMTSMSAFLDNDNSFPGVEDRINEIVWLSFGAVSAEPAPPYLQVGAQDRMRSSGMGKDRVHFHLGQFEETMLRLAEEHGPFDVIQTSNITDWMCVESCDALCKTVQKCLAPGGAVILRRLNGDYTLADVAARTLSVKTADCLGISVEDRAFFYDEVVIGINDSAPSIG